MVDFNCDEVLFLGDMLLLDEHQRHLGLLKPGPAVTPVLSSSSRSAPPTQYLDFQPTFQMNGGGSFGTHNPPPEVSSTPSFTAHMKSMMYSEDVKREADPTSTTTSTTDYEMLNYQLKASPSKGVCRIEDCSRRIRSRGLCKAHGGGRQCGVEGCLKSAHNGDYCIGHGGGKRCKTVDCANAAQSKGLCKAHGGGARCKKEGCTKSSQGRGLCRAHGGGKRCEANGCLKGAQRGAFCATHGGFRNCKVDSCPRTDRGGGFCEVHRKGRMCATKGCKKLSRSEGMCTMHIRCWREQHGNLPVPGSSEDTSCSSRGAAFEVNL